MSIREIAETDAHVDGEARGGASVRAVRYVSRLLLLGSLCKAPRVLSSSAAVCLAVCSADRAATSHPTKCFRKVSEDNL